MKKKLIIIFVVLAIITAPFIYLRVPHYITRDIMLTEQLTAEDFVFDFDYYKTFVPHYYLGSNSLGVCYIASSENLESVLEDLDEDPESLGEHKIKVRFRSIMWYRSDTSGIFTHTPVILYEYVG